jgi:hypothetical protein
MPATKAELKKRRSECYVEMLHHGILSIRALASQGEADLCCIEADFLHNIPRLLASDSEGFHDDFLRIDLACYRRKAETNPGLKGRLNFPLYTELWEELKSIHEALETRG